MLESLIINIETIQLTKTMRCLSAEVLDKMLETVFSLIEEGREPTTEAKQQVAERRQLENAKNNYHGLNYLLAKGGLGVDCRVRAPTINPSTQHQSTSKVLIGTRRSHVVISN